MEVTEHNLDWLVKTLREGEKIIFLSQSDYFKGNKKVITQKPDSNFNNFVGLEVSAVFLDSKDMEKYPISTLLYSLTRVRGEGSKRFSDKFYTVLKSGEGYVFWGNLNG